MIEWWWLLVAFYAGVSCCMLVWVHAVGPVNYREGDWRFVVPGVLLWPIFVLGWLSGH